ncbi:MAG: HupE/UreJ family protein [Caulobacterales bacterium]|nr:HupE/UreJ family protein [Caulobacterales bacterium]
MRILLIALIAAALAPSAALAHGGEGVAGGLLSGFKHPLLGPDHLVAMVAVGLWGAQLGRPLLIALPVAFPLMMAVGGLIGVADVPLPGVEIGIAASALLLGLVVALAFRAPVWLAVALVGVFAIFHGHAHGQELPAAVSPIAYGVGFVTATGLLHAAGIAIGLLTAWRTVGPALVRACGAVIALLGAYFLTGSLGLV